MKFGLRPREGGQSFSNVLEQTRVAEECGFDSVWFAEHYSADDQWWPAPLVNLAALATRTSTISLGTNIVVTPLYNPVWLASATAMLDVISDGRFVCGLGVGYDEAEFAAFDVPLEERVGRTIETIVLLKRLWTREDVSFDGEHFSLDGFTISPKPIQDPRPEIWFGVWGDYLLSQAARRTDAWMPGAVADSDELKQRDEVYRDALAEADAEPAARPLLRDVIVDETDEAAMARAKDLLHEKYTIYRNRDHPFFDAYAEENFASFVEDRAVVGSVESCVEQIEEYRDELGIDHLLVRFPGMDHEEVLQSTRTVADEVVPRVGE